MYLGIIQSYVIWSLLMEYFMRSLNVSNKKFQDFSRSKVVWRLDNTMATHL